jgi:hypothetical protein
MCYLSAMYVGHYAPALLLKARFPEVPLWALFLGAQGVDFLFDGLVMLGVEKLEIHEGVAGPLALGLIWMPYSHSLLSALVFGAGAAAVGAASGRARVGVAMGLAIASHWFGDLLVHGPDLHLGLGAEPRWGLGLWHYPVLSFGVEVLLLGACAAVLAVALPEGRARRRLGGLVLAMGLLQVMVSFGPPQGPPFVFALVALISTTLWTAAAAWVER